MATHHPPAATPFARLMAALVLVTVAAAAVGGCAGRSAVETHGRVYTHPVYVRSYSPPVYTGDYYENITAHGGDALEKQLEALISSNLTHISYKAVWKAFDTTDTQWSSCARGLVHDIYSEKCWTYGEDQCGNYKKEGDCYNREHSWPKSWWGGEDENKDAFTDMHHVFPSDGYVNGRRGNYPLGNVVRGSEVYVSSNGCRLGTCDTDLSLGKLTCFEPAPYMKGDLARVYFFMATRYMDEFDCCQVWSTNGADIRGWVEEQLRQWSNDDPVSEDEMKRNDLVYSIQYNRNPYVDHPEWVHRIPNYGDNSSSSSLHAPRPRPRPTL